MIKPPPKVYDKVCEVCGGPFQSSRRHARTCSDTCRQRKRSAPTDLAARHDHIISELDALEVGANREAARKHLREIREYIDLMLEEV